MTETIRNNKSESGKVHLHFQRRYQPGGFPFLATTCLQELEREGVASFPLASLQMVILITFNLHTIGAYARGPAPPVSKRCPVLFRNVFAIPNKIPNKSYNFRYHHRYYGEARVVIGGWLNFSIATSNQ